MGEVRVVSGGMGEREWERVCEGESEWEKREWERRTLVKNDFFAMAIERGEDLKVYRSAFQEAMDIFEQSKQWPKVERYALTDQIRRSSRAVCANLSEAWRKRRYPKHFVSKLSNADAEASETRTWLRFARSCEYLEDEPFRELDEQYDQICGGLVRMMSAPEKWCGPANTTQEPSIPYDTK